MLPSLKEVHVENIIQHLYDFDRFSCFITLIIGAVQSSCCFLRQINQIARHSASMKRHREGKKGASKNEWVEREQSIPNTH